MRTRRRSPSGAALDVRRGGSSTSPRAYWAERGSCGDAKPRSAALVDLALLESLPPATVVTETPWSTGPQRFEGTRLSTLLEAVGAGGYRVRALGIDDYVAELDPLEVERYPVIVAWRHDGAPMTVRELGPLRIVYPFDDHPELANASGEARSVWQLVRLTVLD